jgi:hypothetical protein
MVSWGEFVTKVLGASADSLKMADNAMEEAYKGAAVLMPKLIWVAQAN